MTQPDWDDERLDAAFHGRFDRPAPPGLEKDVNVRIAGTSPARFTMSRTGRPAWALAAAAVMVILIGTLTVGLGSFGRTAAGSPPPSASDAQATPGANATPTEQAVPGVIFGLPIIHVRDAIAIRDSGVDDRELAVGGWFTPAPVLPCPFTPTVSPLQLRCPDELTWLADDADSLVHVAGGTTSFDSPAGPGLHPDLDGLDTTWFPALPSPGADGGSTPIDVVFVGHFDDRRAALCPAAEQAACRDRFVVDLVAMVHGATTKADRVSPIDATTRSTAFDIETIVANEAPQSPVLSMTIVNGPDVLANFEPSLGTGQQNLIDQSILWIARVLESDRISTYIVVDGSDAIYEMNPEGQAILVGGTPPTSHASPSASAWPPAGATVLELAGGAGIGSPPLRVAIVDRSGRFVSATEQDPPTITSDRRFAAAAEPGKPGRINLTWIGGVCDSQVTVTIGSHLQSITFDMGPQPDCDSMAVGHELVMYFTSSVDVPANVGEATPEASPPPPQGTENVVDCGPLGPDTCDAKAHDIVDANPGKPILTIRFTDECGSYTATYVDGNGVSAIIDCIPGASPG